MHDDKSDALRAAMAIAIGQKKFTLRWEDIATSAGVSRATAFRRKKLQAEWRRACEVHLADSASEAEELRLAAKSSVTRKELHRRLAVMATHLEAMVSLVAMKEIQIGSLERQLGGAAKVVSLTPRSG